MKEFWSDTPGLDDITTALEAYSSSTWRCTGTQPAVIKTCALDRRGYMTAMWVAYVVRNGVVIAPKADDFPPPR